MKRFASVLLISATLLSLPAIGATSAVTANAVHAELVKHIPELKREQVRAAPVAGLFEVDIGGRSVYATPDGKYIVQGDLFEVATRTNLTQARRDVLRHEALAKLDSKDAIVFAPVAPKHTITVFTDVDCGYCRKLHAEIAKLNELGIAVQYVAFPRSGPGTDAWKKMESVWCSSDRRDAITRAKRGESIERPTECSAPQIATQYELGVKVGVKGTPMLVLEDGRSIDGYMPAAQLVKQLEAMNQKSAAVR